jgi:hypothetical protein
MLLLVNLAASALHFSDNMLRFGEYPEPKWITTPHVVDALWIAITPLLAAGWWFANREMKWRAVGVVTDHAIGSDQRPHRAGSAGGLCTDSVRTDRGVWKARPTNRSGGLTAPAATTAGAINAVAEARR